MSRPIKHGMYKTKEYQAWADMKTRCDNPKNKRYKDYGGRGITYCINWSEFSNFYADMGSKPEGTSLDRINNDGNYEPSNCRWATWREQFSSRRSTKLTTIKAKLIKKAVERGLSHEETGKLFSVSQTHVTNIVNGKYWRDNGA